ncbi:transient receptor potential cation channel subfamily A member 1 [Brachionus plicatilis]|uniref:Transient receptor potential cation channel subfamily A member 1 n=1 Tax=Brachionus plicatilis TaxID=10195 RepID=A0A3M7SG27_BRAPC|nr:transient receptor potential cation channel subfamily A member 1 [Brachionus plicatilis]
MVHKILLDLEDKKYFKNDQSKKNDYDHENTLSILIEIFKKRFHGDMKKFYQNYKTKSESTIKDYDERRFRRGKEFFENHEYINKLESIFKNCEDEMKIFLKISAEKFIDFKLLNLIESILDLCSIKLDNDTNLFIFYPLETKIKGYCRNKKIENSSQSLEPDNRGFFSHFYENSVPLSKLRKIDQDNLLSHDLVYNFLHNQWYILGNLFFNLEILLYITFVIFYSLASIRISKEYSFAYEFKWVSLSILIVLIFIEIGELLLLKIYYFYLFSKIFEIINFALVITAISISDENLAQKSNFYSVSLLSTYLCLIFRIEKIVLFGTYVYTLRKILLKSFKVLPIVFVMYLGFYVSLRTRSRYVTEPGQEHDKKEISFTDGFLSLSLIKLSEMLLGNFEADQFGLGDDGATTETFTNFFLINIMIYLMPVFLFNLFIGIAVEEVSDLLKKGQLHLIKIRIDYMIKIFYFLNFLNLEKCVAKFFQPGFMWNIKRKKSIPIYNIRKYFLLMSNKLSNSRWSASYQLYFGRNKSKRATNLTATNP